MIKYKKNLFFFFLISTSLWATPKKIEMIFLSPEKISFLIKQLDEYQSMKKSKIYAQNDLDHCVPMGEGCFHPQYGYIEKEVEQKKIDPEMLENKKLELKTFNAVETSLVNCDKNNYFDIFCGKEKKDIARGEIEVWFDISSSLRTVDYNKDPDQCARRVFMEKIMKACKEKINISIYNTSIKEIGDHSSACLAYGTNDEGRLLSWLKNSEAKHLLLVTDIDEMSLEMKNFLEAQGAKLKGDGVKAFTAKDLIDYAKEFITICR